MRLSPSFRARKSGFGCGLCRQAARGAGCGAVLEVTPLVSVYYDQQPQLTVLQEAGCSCQAGECNC